MKLITVAALCIALLATACGKKEQTVAAAPPDVEVAPVVQKDVPITREWVATLDGFVNAQIRAQVTGYLLKQVYTNGAFVEKGAPLFLIDPRPFQALVEQAQGNVEEAKGKLSQAQGDLQRAQAQLGKTELDVKRYTPLAKESAISQQELDDAVQNNLAAKAQVEANKAAIDAAKASIFGASAALDSAKLNLGFTNIVSPVAGIAAIATAQVGNLVGPQGNPLTTVSTIDPILVNFTPSEQEYLAVANQTGASPGSVEDRVKSIEDRVNSVEDRAKKLVFHLQLANGTEYSHTGRLYAVNSTITSSTGSILVQISFPNPGNVLRPGGFGKISTVTHVQRGALLVPQRSVSDVQGTYLIAIMGTDNKIAIRQVTPGARVGSMWIIDKGLNPGDQIVVEGIQKVKEGMRVTPKPYSPPGEDATQAAS
jgi:membrane fusion protein (multidrug efflux system)